MPIPKIIGAQRDFSGGEVDEALKRSDEMSVMKTGARQLINFRLLSGGQAQNRPGRRALFLESGRVEEVLMSPGNIFYLAFGNHYLRVYNAAGARVAESYVKGDGVTQLPWTVDTANSIVYAIAPKPAPTIYITYGHDLPINIPQVLTWDGVSQTSSWSLANFAEALLASGQKRTIFDRLSPPNITLLPSAVKGAITLTASDPVFEPGMVGSHLLWCGREVLLTGYVSGTVMNATVIEQLPNSVSVQAGFFLDAGNGNKIFSPGYNGYFLPGDLVEGSISGARGIVQNHAGDIVIQIIPTANPSPISYYLEGVVGLTQYFVWQEYIVGQNGVTQVGSTALAHAHAVSVWDDEVMNDYRGWPTSCFYDQGRLGFCGFPGAPSAIAWSSLGLPDDFYVNGLATSVNADNAIFESAPGESSVYFVVPGMESSEFVFCSNALYYIPITPAQPLTPGSVQFNLIASQGSYPNVKPVQIQQSILYARAGGAGMGAVQTPGYYFRPNVVDIVSEFHSHLFGIRPVALAAPQSPTQFEENYAYLLREDGTIVTTRYMIRNGLIEAGPEGKPKMGWLKWTGVGQPTWIAAQGGDLILTVVYAVGGEPWSSGFSAAFGGVGGGASVSMVEILDNGQYLDCAVNVNAPPTALAAPPGKGSLWFFANQTVALIDLGTRIMGTYKVDADGNLVPQFVGGENLQSGALVAGQPWTATLEPFVPDAPAGQSVGQRMKKRRVARMTVYVSRSTGFMMARLFAGPITPTGPGLGEQMNIFRVPPWNIGDDSTLAPPFREQAYRWRPSGRAFDPRMVIIKDTPGPLVVNEIGFEITT